MLRARAVKTMPEQVNFVKVLIAIVLIGMITGIAKDKTTAEQRSLGEIALSILFAAWIISGKW